MADFIDDINRKGSVSEYPGRIITLVPSVTETIIDLGWRNRLQGRTHYCIHPAEEVNAIPSIGGTHNIDFKQIRNITPDLILAVKEENDKEQVYRFTNQEIEMLKDWFPQAEVVRVDGEIFSWYGTPMRFIADYSDKLPQSKRPIIRRDHRPFSF